MPLNLPPELLLEILEFAGSEPWGVFCADHATLRACALVARSWTAYAQLVLFKKAVFDTCDDGRPHRFEEFYETLQALRARGSRLPSAVRIMSVDIGVAHVGSDVVIRHAQLRTVAEAIQMCPNLQSLQLFLINEGTNLIRFDDFELSLIAQTKNIRHLSVIGTVEDDVLLRQTLALWPVTRLTVEFSGYYLMTHSDMPDLNLEAFQALDEPPLEFVDHMVRSPTVAIRHLRIHTISDLDVLIRPFVRSLRELFLGFPEAVDGGPAVADDASSGPATLSACERSAKWTWPCPDVLADCTQLKHFGVGAPASKAMLDALPPGIEIFGLSPHTCSPADIDVFCDYLTRRVNVHTIELQVYRNSMDKYPESMRIVEPLRAFCRSKGIGVIQREMEYCLFTDAY